MQAQKASNHIKKLATEAGFDLVRITKPYVPSEAQTRFERWLKQGYAADMEYLHRNKTLRYNPTEIQQGTQSVIVLGLNYYTKEIPDIKYSVSKYALGRDYHKLIKSKLKALVRKIKADFPELETRPFVDSAPVLERSLAVQSGMGWIGKNTCLINKEKGSFLFLAELFVNIELKEDAPYTKNYCGNCTQCIDTCPTQALSLNGLDSNRCISYHSIESKDEIPENIAKKMGNQLFGCDICQDVCPWNQKITQHQHEDLSPGKHLQYLNSQSLSAMDDVEFTRQFAGTAFLRAGRKKLLQTMEQLKNKDLC